MPQFTYVGPHLRATTNFPDGSTIEDVARGEAVEVTDAQAGFLAGNAEWEPAAPAKTTKKATSADTPDDPAPVAEED